MTTPSRGADLLRVEDLHTYFPIRSGLLRRTTGYVRAVQGVSFQLKAGQTLGLVGESGSGKSTVARTILGLERANRGSIYFDGEDIASVPVRRRHGVCRDIQMIFQDPYASLNPRRTVEEIVSEGWRVHPSSAPPGPWSDKVKELLERVGLDPDQTSRYPHQFSGGQRQRIGIARAMALKPRLIVCDEAVSALDVSVQAQVLNLLADLQQEFGLSYLFIAHDLAVVNHIADEVAVMYLGKVVEAGTRTEVFTCPVHPYTQALLSAVPVARPWRQASPPARIVLEGDIPSPAAPPTGCQFRTRCWKAEDVCAEVDPDLEERIGQHDSACHFASPDVR